MQTLVLNLSGQLMNQAVSKIYDKVLAIDGPSGSGKSTLARMVAEKLKHLYIDTGAMYRALGITLIEALNIVDDENLAAEFEKINSDQINAILSNLKLVYGQGSKLVEVNGRDLTDIIRDHRVSYYASIVSKNELVRDFLKQFQRQLVENQPSVMEGRDIGTVVFPNAYCKIFLTASAEIRAKRRVEQLRELGQAQLNFEDVLKDILKRDDSDMNRKTAPLIKASDAFELDTTDLSKSEVVEKMVSIAQMQIKKLSLEELFNS
jgi:CMP/dCMP kinase